MSERLRVDIDVHVECKKQIENYQEKYEQER